MKLEALRIYYDSSSGEVVSITQSEAFEGESSLLRLDVLQDVAGVIGELHEKETKRSLAEFSELRQRYSK